MEIDSEIVKIQIGKSCALSAKNRSLLSELEPDIPIEKFGRLKRLQDDIDAKLGQFYARQEKTHQNGNLGL